MGDIAENLALISDGYWGDLVQWRASCYLCYITTERMDFASAVHWVYEHLDLHLVLREGPLRLDRPPGSEHPSR